MCNVVASYVALHVVNRHDWNIVCKGKSLCVRNSNQKCANKPRPLGDSNKINIIQGHVSVLQCLVDYKRNRLNVHTASNLRDHSTVDDMGVDLACNYI